MNQGTRIRRIRKALGFALKDMASVLDVGTTTYHRLETEDIPLLYERAVKLARFFGCSTDDFDEMLGGPIDRVIAKLLLGRGMAGAVAT
jgi:transcriptional regulator with XRE-family HTH domain